MVSYLVRNHLNDDWTSDPYFDFKSEAEQVALVGCDSDCYILEKAADLDAYGKTIDGLAGTADAIFGFVSYQCFNVGARADDRWPLAIFCAATRRQMPIYASRSRERNARPVVDDADSRGRYARQVLAASEWIAKAPRQHRRVTLSRTVPIGEDVDVARSFSSYRPFGVTRSFALGVRGLRIVGHSPELLVSGTAKEFDTYKLSGTAARALSEHDDKLLLSDMLTSRRLTEEHAGAVVATSRRLASIGDVSVGHRDVLELRRIRHFVTKFTTRPRLSRSLWAILRAATPSGAYPERGGIELINELEEAARGPYYGLLGFADSSGRVEFVQVLRSVFLCSEAYVGERQWYTQVGAAITGLSDPAEEVVETQLKLSEIEYVPRA
jgi:anthranilate/para-aminobenzoate synthase component I